MGFGARYIGSMTTMIRSCCCWQPEILSQTSFSQICHDDHSRNPSIISSISSYFGSICSSRLEEITSRSTNSSGPKNYNSHIGAVWEEQYQSGVHITLASLADGTKFVKMARFSRIKYEEEQAVRWWVKNSEKVCKKYNAWGWKGISKSCGARQRSISIYNAGGWIYQVFLGPTHPPSFTMHISQN